MRAARSPVPLGVALAGLAVVAALGAAGCREEPREGEPAPGATPEPGESGRSAPEGAVPPGDTASAEPAALDTAGRWTIGIEAGGGGAGEVALLEEVRLGRHPDFDRVVWTFADGLPGWHAEYVDRPVRACGSGEPVPLPGDGWLEVRFEPAQAHDEEGRPTATVPEARGAGTILQVARTCDFEAVVTWVLAVRSPEPYRVLELADPPRIVVDVRRSR